MDEFEAADDLGPENEEQLARLRRALILGAGFQIVFLEIAQPSLTSEILRRLRRWSGRDGIPELAIVRTRPGRDPVAPLRRISVGAVLLGIDQSFDIEGIESELVSVDDGEPEVSSDTTDGDPVEYTMTTLNWHRDELPSLVKGPLVLVLSPDGLRRLFVHAPDLLAWRSHTTRVAMPRPTDLEIRPRPSQRASLEERAWLEEKIAFSDSNTEALPSHGLPGWLIRLGELDARQGRSGEDSFSRAEKLAGQRHHFLFQIERARAHRALDEGRYEDAWLHIIRLGACVGFDSSAKRDTTFMQSLLESHGWGAPLPNPLVLVEVTELGVVLAEHALRTGDIDYATAVAEAVLEPARAYGDSTLVITALTVAAAAASHRGDRAAAAARFGEMQVVARRAQDPAAEGFALTRLAELAPDVAAARALYREALSLLEDEPSETRMRPCLGLARCELRLENPKEAERVLSRLELAELSPRSRLRVLATRGDMAWSTGHHDEALAAYQAAWDESRHAPMPPRAQASLGIRLGNAALRAGKAEAGRDALERACEIASLLADPELDAIASLGLARVTEASEDTATRA